MALHRDFMMRMIERLAAAFFRIMAGKSAESPEQTQVDIEDLVAEALGTSREYALGLGPAAMETVEPALAVQVSRLLFVHALLSDELRDPERAARARRMAFRGVELALQRPATDAATLAAELLREHFESLAALVPREGLAGACIGAHRAAGKRRDWAGAEDWAFFAIELDSAHADEARAFFDELRSLDDGALADGGVTRDDVEQCLIELAASD